MTSKRIKQIVTCAIFAALICVTTMFVSVPAPLAGNVNLGDAIIIIASFLLGPLFGAIAGGVGAALADLFSAYAIYAPATFFIKAALAVVCYYVFKAMLSLTKNSIVSRIIAVICAELTMVLGYFIYEIFILGFPTALADVPFNLIQGAFGAVIGTVITILLLKNKTISSFVSSLEKDKNDTEK